MTRHTYTSREFNQQVSDAKRAASEGPVFITDRGRPAHVLLSFGDYEKLCATANPSWIETNILAPVAAFLKATQAIYVCVAVVRDDEIGRTSFLKPALGAGWVIRAVDLFRARMRGSHQGCGRASAIAHEQAGYMHADHFLSTQRARKTHRVHICTEP